jgi:hypothetical protein
LSVASARMFGLWLFTPAACTSPSHAQIPILDHRYSPGRASPWGSISLGRRAPLSTVGLRLHLAIGNR